MPTKLPRKVAPKDFTLFAVLTWLFAEGCIDSAEQIIQANAGHPDSRLRRELQAISRAVTLGDNRAAAMAADKAARAWYEMRHKLKPEDV